MLQTVEERIQALIASVGDSQVEALYARLKHGKRLRAKLVLMIADASDSAITLAAIIEMIHAASLLHDDVIDEAQTRRGAPSLHIDEGNKRAIMMGDILYAKGFEALCAFDRSIAKTIASAVTKLSVGEMMDVALSKSFSPDKESYMRMIYLKTAALIEATAEAAALLSGRDRTSFALYGKNLGIAFQMIDDLLDITQSTERLGKPAMHDFEEGKTTLPYIYLYEALDAAGKERLARLHGKPLDEAECRWILSAMEQTGALQKSRQEARVLAQEAVALMQAHQMPELAQMAQSMIEREF